MTVYIVIAKNAKETVVLDVFKSELAALNYAADERNSGDWTTVDIENRSVIDNILA